jgi:6-pyruvoyl-tetrahydropterin synthase
MSTITVEHTISMGHRLPSYDGICSSPHGHNVRVVVDVYVPTGLFIDFKDVQGVLRAVLDDLDHAMVLFVDDPLAEILIGCGFRTVLLNVEPTTENIATWILTSLVKGSRLRATAVTGVTVHETAKYSACATVPDQELLRVF